MPVEAHVAVLVLVGEAAEVRPQLGLERALLGGELEVLGGRVLDVHVVGLHAERVADVGDPGEVAVHRVGDVDAHAAVQVVAGAHRAGRLVAGPVRRDREVVGDVEPLADPPGGVGRGQVEGARGDVDVRDLHRDRLELRERPAELGAALDVRRGQVARAGDDAGRGQAEAGGRQLLQGPRGVGTREQLGGCAVEDDGVLGGAGRRARREQLHARAGGVDQRDDVPVAVGGGDEQPVGAVGVRHADLAAGDGAVAVRRGRQLAQRRGQQRLAGGDAGQQRLLLLGGAGRGEGQHAAAEGLPDREWYDAVADLAQQHADLGQPEPLAAVRLGNGQREQSGGGERLPVGLSVVADALQRLADDAADRLGRLQVLRHVPLLPTSQVRTNSETVTCSSLADTTIERSPCAFRLRDPWPRAGSTCPTSGSPRAGWSSCPAAGRRS